MSIDTRQFKSEIIVPTLRQIDLYSKSAVNLLLLTCAQESLMGTYLRQLEGGPALGVYEMEPNTFNDIINNYLVYRPILQKKIFDCLPYSNLDELQPSHLVWNFKLATIMARIHYLRCPDPLPAHDDILGLAKYWKKHYNTAAGKGTVEMAVANYNMYVKVGLE